MATSRRLEAKTSLACDRCRQRKSRCDGLRPRCSHCTAVGIECHYRPTVASLESDVTLLARLDHVEARIQSLENSAQAAQHASRTGQDSGLITTQSGITAPPQFHTASALAMIHSWPRLRLCFASSGNPLEVLADADRQDPFVASHEQMQGTTPISGHEEGPWLQLWQATDILNSLNSSRQYAPLMLQLIMESHQDLKPDSLLQATHGLDSAVINPNDLTPLQAMGMCLAIVSQEAISLPNEQPIVCEYFNSALQRQWMLWNTAHERIALNIAIAYGLLNYWARPYQAVGALLSVKTSLVRMNARFKNSHSRVAILSALYFMIESDVLTEVDEYSTDTILSAETSLGIEVPSFMSLETTYSSPGSGLHSTFDSLDHRHLDKMLWLRSHMNQILHLYTPVRAYARPHELADLVFRLGASLREWYQRLPLEKQFPRDIVTFAVYESSMRHHKTHRELALQYHACVFLLHRPVLYFFLHKDMEYAIQPPGGDNGAADHSPWVMESCRDCIESVALIIRLCHTQVAGQATYAPRYWPEYQLMFASYLILLQVRTYTSLEPFLRIIGNVDVLLDLVEDEFRANANRSPVLSESLNLLVTTRRNLDATSPSQVD